jgi:hypothetical protein
MQSVMSVSGHCALVRQLLQAIPSLCIAISNCLRLEPLSRSYAVSLLRITCGRTGLSPRSRLLLCKRVEIGFEVEAGIHRVLVHYADVSTSAFAWDLRHPRPSDSSKVAEMCQGIRTCTLFGACGRRVLLLRVLGFSLLY